MVDAHETRARLGDWLALAFWPLWALVLVLQLLDVGSVALASLHGAPIHELNPIMLDLMARLGTMAALLVKFAAAVAWLGLALGVWALASTYRWWRAQAWCVALLALVAVWSAWVFWQNIAAVTLVAPTTH